MSVTVWALHRLWKPGKGASTVPANSIWKLPIITPLRTCKTGQITWLHKYCWVLAFRRERLWSVQSKKCLKHACTMLKSKIKCSAFCNFQKPHYWHFARSMTKFCLNNVNIYAGVIWHSMPLQNILFLVKWDFIQSSYLQNPLKKQHIAF